MRAWRHNLRDLREHGRTGRSLGSATFLRTFGNYRCSRLDTTEKRSASKTSQTTKMSIVSGIRVITKMSIGIWNSEFFFAFPLAQNDRIMQCPDEYAHRSQDSPPASFKIPTGPSAATELLKWCPNAADAPATIGVHAIRGSEQNSEPAAILSRIETAAPSHPKIIFFFAIIAIASSQTPFAKRY